MAYWLFKTEPDECSIDDILAAPKQTVPWEGIRNYQARNFLRDHVALHDQIFIYHSQCKPTAIVGLAQVVSQAYPDPAQFDPESPYFDPKSNRDNPRWVCLDIKFSERFRQPMTLAEIKASTALTDIALVKQGRLSVTPVKANEAAFIFSYCR
jgi:predicted RNA-binding protein with PUA-like domain